MDRFWFTAKASTLVTLILLACSSAKATDDYLWFPVAGFYTGNMYRALPELHQRTYVAGVLDGFQASSLFLASTAANDKLFNCLKGKPVSQLHAIFEKYLAEHPERWDEYANALLYNALVDVCGKFYRLPAEAQSQRR